MLRGENIICFAKDWHEDPTSNNHVMRLLARDNRVLWVNSIATRTPRLSSGRDLRKIGQKVLRFARDAVRGAEKVDHNLWVFTPLVVPLPSSDLARAANRRIVRDTLSRLRRGLGFDAFQLWSFLPTAAPYAGGLGESLLVYYITDEFSQFTGLDGDRIAAMERDLCRRADLVFCTSHSLLAAKRIHNPETHLASHGVDHAHFAAALDGELEPAPEVSRLRRPVLGFFGLIGDWIDLDLVEGVARRRPEWSIVLVGEAQIDLGRLRALPNVLVTGRRPYAELPRYCKAFDLAFIPFLVNDLTRHVNPVKLREYMSAGLPVVTTPLPECRHYAEPWAVVSSSDEMVAAVERALAEDSPARRRARSRSLASETWEDRVREIGERIVRVRDRREAARLRGAGSP